MSSTGDSKVYVRKSDELLQCLNTMQTERYKIFKEQDLEKGRFDVTFEVEGKMLHAHRFVLTSVSEPLDSWLSDRWTTKDAVIKIEDYPYDCFHEFLCFLYAGTCALSQENIVKMTDMAEFYGVQCLKDFCDEFLTDMEKTVESIEELYEFAQKYILPKLIESIQIFFCRDIAAVCKSDVFITFKKSFVEFLFKSDVFGYAKEALFEVAYKWAEHRVLKDKTAADDESSYLLDAIKAELKNIVLPELDFSRMNYGFLMDFVVEKGFLLTPAELSQFFIYRSRRGCCLQHAFKNTYNVAEKQVLKKQEIYHEESFNLNDSINAYLVDVIPLVKFPKMDPEFLSSFVVKNGFFLSPAEFSEAFLTQTFSFQDIYELAEKQALKKQEMYAEESFNLRDSISASLVDVMPNVKFSTMSFEVLMTFVFEKGFLLSPAELAEYFLSRKANKYNDCESVFKETIEMAEKIALMKQEILPEEDFNLAEAIKTYLVEVLPHIDFQKMDNSFLTDFIVSNQIISEEQANQVSETLVEIKNDGKIITGVFKDVHRIRRFLESCHQRARNVKRQNISLIRFPQLKFPVPSTPSTVEKMKGVDWYFCLDDGVFAFKNYSAVRNDDYLIAEMKSAEEFQLVPGETTYLTVRFNNLK